MKRLILTLVALLLFFTFISTSEARWYEPESGRFLSEDQIGFEGGDVNLYRYVGNNPMSKIDPTGLYECTYSISQHRMVCTPNTIPHPSFESTNFVAGNNRKAPEQCNCQNNPDATDQPFYGPIPVGDYTIRRQRRGSSRRNLTPIGFQNMYGRSAFQIHGCGNPNTCSEGCIGATTNATRDRFNSLMSLEEGNNSLHVQP